MSENLDSSPDFSLLTILANTPHESKTPLSGSQTPSAASVDRGTLKDLEDPVDKEQALPSGSLQSDDDFPDGGLRAWLVLLGTSCATFASFGFVNSWGVFQSYYEGTLLHGTPSSSIAWIGSIQYSLVFMPALLSGRLFDLGYFRGPLTISSVMLIVTTFVTGECKEYWRFLLCQGFGLGLSAGWLWCPSIAVISHWFKRRRGFALGLNACGASLGGTVFPIIFRQLIDKIGFPWTMRVLGFIIAFMVAIANLTMARRLPPVNLLGGLLNLRAFKSAAYSVYVLSAFVCFLGLYTVLTYIDVSASRNGVDISFSFYLVAIANAASLLGRFIAGILSDMIGPINVMTPFTAFGAILTYVWPFVYGKSSYIALAILYGFSCGTYASLLQAPVVAFGGTGDVGRRTGMAMTLLAFGSLVGPPISGAINVITGDYRATGIYSGTVILVSVILMWTARCLALGGWRGKF